MSSVLKRHQLAAFRAVSTNSFDVCAFNTNIDHKDIRIIYISFAENCFGRVSGPIVNLIRVSPTKTSPWLILSGVWVCFIDIDDALIHCVLKDLRQISTWVIQIIHTMIVVIHVSKCCTFTAREITITLLRLKLLL